MKKVLIIHHRSDNDGVLSAAILAEYISAQDRDTLIKFYAAEYADLSQIWEEHVEYRTFGLLNGRISTFQKWLNNYDTIFMTDISFNDPLAMDELFSQKGDRFIWCDHHAPIIAESQNHEFGKCSGIRRTDQSAILCVWQHCFPYEDYPHLFQQLSDYDSWQWSIKEDYVSESARNDLFALNTGITRRSNLKIDWFRNLVHDVLNRYNDDECFNNLQSVLRDCLEYGRIIMDYDSERALRAIKQHGDCTWTLAGEKACALFTTDRFNSRSFASFADTEIRHGLVFRRNPDGQWILSAYNVSDDEEELHCGDYLKKMYGGGGHHGAAGCTLSEAQFLELLKTHTV